MYIARDLLMRPVTDFIKNVKPKLNDGLVVEEVYESKLLVGWRIVKLKQ